MGGKAIKKVKINRIDILIYQQLKTYIVDKLSEHVYIDFFIDIPNKTDFGDLDVIYIYKNTQFDIKKIIIELFNPPEIVSNGDVISIAFDKSLIDKSLIDEFNLTNTFFDVEYYQVDFIKCPNLDLIPMYKFYFSYGDFGTIIGRIVNHYALKIGHQGLWINLINPTINEYERSIGILDSNESSNDLTLNDITKSNIRINLSSDPRKILEYIGLDYDKWLIGFTNIESIFEFICQSPLFDCKIFDQLNHDHVNRTILRPFYNKFINYIIQFKQFKQTELKIKSNLTIYAKIGHNKQFEALKFFQKIDILIDNINHIKLKKERHDKFNGNLIINMIKEFDKFNNFTDNKIIGKLINDFKIHILSIKLFTSFDCYLDINTIQNIKLDLYNFLSQYVL